MVRVSEFGRLAAWSARAGTASVLFALGLAAACGDDDAGASGSGGATATGGASPSGGSKAQGGKSNGGGSPSTGGGSATTGGGSAEAGQGGEPGNSGGANSGGTDGSAGEGAGGGQSAGASGAPSSGGGGTDGGAPSEAGSGGDAGASPDDPCERLAAVGSCDQREGEPPGTCYEFHDPPFVPSQVPCMNGTLLESACPAGDELTGYCLGAVLGRSEYYYGDAAIEGQADCLDGGGQWCPTSCAAIEASYAEALAGARACNPTLGAAQCTETRSDGPGCGCPMRVNQFNGGVDFLAELARLTQLYADAGCDLNACPDPEECIPLEEFGCRGTSVSDSVCAPP